MGDAHWILVVDDELGPREALRMILKSKYQVLTAVNGPDALQMLSNTPPDIVLLDIKMREMNGIGFPGAPYRQTFFVADTEARGEMKPAELNVYLWRDGFHLFFPMRGENRWRVIGILPKSLRERADLQFDDLIPEIRREAGASLQFNQCFWFSTYRIFHRAAEQFRKGQKQK